LLDFLSSLLRVVSLNPGWRVLNVSGNSNNEALTGPWNFNANNDPGNTNDNNGSLLSHFLSNNSEKTVRWSIL
jgi:hypothetical protein